MYSAAPCSQLCSWLMVCNQLCPAQPEMPLPHCASCSMHRPCLRIAVPERTIWLYLGFTVSPRRCPSHRCASRAELVTFMMSHQNAVTFVFQMMTTLRAIPDFCRKCQNYEQPEMRLKVEYKSMYRPKIQFGVKKRHDFKIKF